MANNNLETLIARVEKLRNFSVRAGVLGGATYADTGKHVAEVAYYNEYGTSTIPSRPFMRNAIAKNRNDWNDGFSTMLRAFLAGRKQIGQVADKMGVAMQVGIHEMIDSDMPPPNTEFTRQRKESRGMAQVKTLIDSGTLRESITYDYEV